ncbi:MAG: hypothetical protein E6Q97_30725 [Desulfurellales bacterium]|nr:MAG: hypothetical protein E6Q97_30725 [Desulfurellales bacterium]
MSSGNSGSSEFVLPISVLDGYPSGTACIHYRDGSGKVKDWYVGCVPGTDNEQTLREHLQQHLPAAEFVGFAMK